VAESVKGWPRFRLGYCFLPQCLLHWRFTPL